jgi:hypothetical protein
MSSVPSIAVNVYLGEEYESQEFEMNFSDVDIVIVGSKEKQQTKKRKVIDSDSDSEDVLFLKEVSPKRRKTRKDINYKEDTDSEEEEEKEEYQLPSDNETDYESAEEDADYPEEDEEDEDDTYYTEDENEESIFDLKTELNDKVIDYITKKVKNETLLEDIKESMDLCGDDMIQSSMEIKSIYKRYEPLKCSVCNLDRKLNSVFIINSNQYKIGTQCITRLELLKDTFDILKNNAVTYEEIKTYLNHFDKTTTRVETEIKDFYDYDSE